jgi:hypothetical protein
VAIFDLSNVVRSFANETITFQRQTQALDSAGIYTTTELAFDPVLCSVQPIEGKQAQAEIELINSTAGLTVWTELDLVVGEPGGQPGDRFVWEGDTYEIRFKSDWQTMGSYREYKAGKLN